MIAARTSANVRLRVLQAGPDAEIFRLARAALAGSYRIEYCSVATEAELRAALQESEWDLLLCDPTCRGANCKLLFSLLAESGSDARVVALADEEDEALAAELIRLGACAVLGRARLGRLAPIVARELDDVRSRRLRELDALLASSPDPMLIAGSDGRIRNVNRLLENLLGFSAAELAGEPVELLLPTHLRERHVAHRTRYTLAPAPRPMGVGVELAARHKDGTQIPVEISLGPVAIGGEHLVVCGLRDLRERVRAERLLRAILEGTAAQTGEAFLRALVKSLAAALEVRYAFVSEVLPLAPERMRVLAFWSAGAFAPPHSYELDGSPCAEVIRRGELLARSGICERFPRDLRLRRLACESFFGLRLETGAAEPLGVLAIGDVGPLGDEATARTVMQIFAARAGAELERARIARRLAEREKWFRDLVELSADWYWEQDEHLRFVVPPHHDPASDRWTSTFIGKTRWEAAPDALSAQQWATHRQQLEAREEFRDLEYAHPLPDGRMRWVSVSGRPVYDEDGRFRGYRGVAQDITARKEIELLLRESEARFREIFRAAPDPMTLVRAADEVYVDVNAAFEETTGYRREEVLGRTSRDIELWAEPGRREHMFRELARTGRTRDFEYVMRRRDGSLLVTALSASAVEIGEEAYYLFLIRDITARRRAEDALRASEAELRLIADNLPAMICDIGPDRCLRFANRALAEFCGCGEAPAQQRALAAGLQECVWALIGPLAERALGGERIAARERCRRPDDGSLCDLEVALIPKCDSAGQPDGIVALILDVTARTRIEEKLQLANRALDASLNAIVITRSAAEGYRIVYVNPAFERITGYTAAEVIGRNPRFLHGEERDQPGLDRLRSALRENEEATVLVRNYRKDGTPFWSELRVAPVRDAAGTVTHYVGISADVTDRVEAQQRLQELAAELERRVEERTSELRAAMRELESFSYTVSHDLRAPLRAIAGFTHLLREHSGAMLGGEGLRLVDRIEANAMHMAALIDGLLALAQHSRRPLDKKPIDVGSLVGEVLGSLRQELQALDAEVVVAELPACHADPVLLRQVFANLLSNAMKYSAMRKPPRIEIGAREERGETVYWVRDNGVGFDMRYAQRMFRPFERMHSASEFPGIGIGLSIVRRIVERHGGRIWAESAPGEGATFSFTLGPDRANGAGRSG